MTIRLPTTALLSAILLGTASMPACRKGAEQPAANAAIVPGADFVARLDLNAIRQAPIFETLSKKVMAEASIADDPSTASPGGSFDEFVKATGLGKDEAGSFFMTGDVDGLEWGAPDVSRRLQHVNVVVAVTMKKPLTHAELREGLESVMENQQNLRVEDTNVAGREALRFEKAAEGETQSFFAALSKDGHTLFLTFNQPTLAGAIEREENARFETLPPELANVESSYTTQSHAQLTFLVPEGWRQNIEEQLQSADQNPQAAMMSGFLRPLRNIQSWSLGLHFDTGMEIRLASDLGDESAAQQATMMLQMMALPMLKGAMAQSSGQTPAELDQAIQLNSQGATLSLSLRLSEQQLASLQEQAAARAQAVQ